MNSLRESSSMNSSISSPNNDSNDDLMSTSIKNQLKEALKSKIFLGRYVERRLANERVGYRDLVVVSPAEVELRNDLVEVQQKLRSTHPGLHWIGITDTNMLGYNSPGLCLWTEIDNQPFGVFWFQIKTIQFRGEEAIIKVKCLRQITDAFLEAEPILTSGKKANECIKTVDNGAKALTETYSEMKQTLQSVLSVRNVKEFVTFLFAFVIAIFTGSTAFVNFLGNFILALIRELSILVKNLTPTFLGVLDFFSKIVGGFYILMAMMFRPSATPQPQQRRRLSYEPVGANTNMYYKDFD